MLRVSELFYSLQGEGVFVGHPSIFIRLAGCNLRCTWCDTKYALSFEAGKDMSPSELADEVLAMIDATSDIRDASIVITGGEPMLQQADIATLLRLLTDQSSRCHITIETNGTVSSTDPSLPDMVDLLSVSPKLSNSGVFPKSLRYKPDILLTYMDLYHLTVFKFVIKDEQDFKEVEDDFISLGLPKRNIFLMPVGRTRQQLASREQMVADLCLEHGVNYSTRLQIKLWNGERGK